MGGSGRHLRIDRAPKRWIKAPHRSGNPAPPPVRSYCELQGIPVHKFDEDSTGFWTLRETQSMIDGLRARDSALIDVPTIRH